MGHSSRRGLMNGAGISRRIGRSMVPEESNLITSVESKHWQLTRCWRHGSCWILLAKTAYSLNFFLFPQCTQINGCVSASWQVTKAMS